MHRVGDRVHEIYDPEEPDEAPALKIGVEGEVYDDARREYADNEPGLELAPAGACALDDVAHDGVVERIEDSCGNNDGGNRGELRIGEAAGEEDEGHYAACEEEIHHVAADRAEREHYKVFLSDFKIFHVEAPII